jgi:hypothetical protein
VTGPVFFVILQCWASVQYCIGFKVCHGRRLAMFFGGYKGTVPSLDIRAMAMP